MCLHGVARDNKAIYEPVRAFANKANKNFSEMSVALTPPTVSHGRSGHNFFVLQAGHKLSYPTAKISGRKDEEELRDQDVVVPNGHRTFNLNALTTE